MRAWISLLLLRLIGIRIIRDELGRSRIDSCISAVKMGPDSRFYGTAEVHNLKGIRDDILIGNHSHIRGELLVFAGGGRIRIGDYCYVGEGSRIWSADDVNIGDHVLISHNVNIIDTDSHELDHLKRAESYKTIITSGHPSSMGDVRSAPIRIEDHAWISYNACILKGITIGEGAVVAAGSVVTVSVEPFTVVAGNPARVVRKLK